jgi:hypothetical protein
VRSVRVVVYCDNVTARRRAEIAWAAGLFEGEGCITQSGGRLAVRLNGTDRTVIDRFCGIVGEGKVYGPYTQDGCADAALHRRKPYFVWVAYGGRGLNVLLLLDPWLSERRRVRAFELIVGLHVKRHVPT